MAPIFPSLQIILLSSSYRNQEFVRVGWYVQNFFFEPQFIENPPDLDEMTVEDMVPRMKRVILAGESREEEFEGFNRIIITLAGP